MSFLKNLFGVFDDRMPESTIAEGYTRPTFDPGIMRRILEGMPGMTDLFGNQFLTGAGGWSMIPGAGPTYADKMQDYVQSTGKQAYEQTVLPGLQRRGVLSRPGAQSSREEALFTRDWGKMLTDEALRASAEGEKLDIQQKLGSQENFLKSLQAVMEGAAKPATGQNLWQKSTHYY